MWGGFKYFKSKQRVSLSKEKHDEKIVEKNKKYAIDLIKKMLLNIINVIKRRGNHEK